MRQFKYIYKTLFLAMVVGMLVSCVKDNEDVVDFDVALAFNPAIYSPVKSNLNGTYPNGIAFGVTAFSLPKELVWESGSGNGEAFLNNEKVEQEGTKWLPVSRCNWPHVSKTLTAIAYSPYGAATECNFTNGVVFENIDTDVNEDILLYTLPVADAHKGLYGGVIALPFKHALCNINIKLKNLVEDNQQIIVKSVKLLDIRNKGSFKSIPAAQWEIQNTTSEVMFFNGEYASTQSPEAVGENYLAIPQVLNTCFEVEFVYHTQSGTYINQTLRTRAVETLLEAGRNYTYTISVGIDEVKFMLEVIDSYLQ